MSRFLLLIAALVVFTGCTGREPGRQDSKPATDQRPRTGEPAPPVAAQATTAGPAELPALSERHVDDRFGFELSFPSGWSKIEGPDAPGLVTAVFVNSPRGSSSDEFVENVNVVVEPLPDRMTAETYAADATPMMQTLLSEYALLSERTVELAGQPAVRREYHHTFEGRPLWVVSYMLVVGQQAYVITGTAERSTDLAGWQPMLDAVALSFQLQPRP